MRILLGLVLVLGGIFVAALALPSTRTFLGAPRLWTGGMVALFILHSWHAINPAHVRPRSGLDDSYALLVSLSVELLELRQLGQQRPYSKGA